MFSSERNSILVGLEIGTAKVCAVVGEVNSEGHIHIIGLGQAPSRGVRKGEIVDPSMASEDVRIAVAEAEQMADMEIRNVYLAVTGAHMEGFNNRGRHNIASADREITEEDVQDVVKNAKAVNVSADHEVVHVIRQHFWVDNRPGIPNPVGMVGAQMEVDVHVVHGNTNRLQNPVHVVRNLQLTVEDVVFSGVASSLAVLTPQEKEVGALVIDMGAGATEYAVYGDGVIRQTGVLAVGGDHVSNDLAYGLRVSMGRAEELKVSQGCAVLDDADRGRSLNAANPHGLPERSVKVEHLRRIMSLRLEETFEIIAERLAGEGLLDDLRAGVILCGGGARVPEIERLAQRVFGCQASIGRTKSISGLVSTLDQPEFATGIGLVKFGSFQRGPRKVSNGLASRLKSRLSQMLLRT